MDKKSKILIVGEGGIVDQSLLEYFRKNGYENTASSADIGIDTVIQPAVYEYFQKNRPEYVFLSSVASGGIKANVDHPADFLYRNSESQNNIIHASYKFKVRKLIYYASSCVYPKECPQPMKPEHLLTGPLEETSQAYALAKLSGIELCRAYRRQYGFKAVAAVPATVYGIKSDTDAELSHVIGALIGKFLDAVQNNKTEVVVWGTGNPKREFLHTDDFTAASMFLMDHYDGEEIINIGSGEEVSVKDLAFMIAQEIGFKGNIVFDASKPEGVMRKLLDSSALIQLGFKPRVRIKDGVKDVIHFLNKKGS